MCRIYGSFGIDASNDELMAAAKNQIHGGPDSQHLRRGSGWALGANRLAIMDPAGGSQPYELDGVCVVFNGEIYNHNELRAELIRRGHAFTDRCDGSILPALYLEYGPLFVDHLDGMYALAVIDNRGDPMLLLATDHVGMKPLYYHWSPTTRCLFFSSELAGLLAFSDVPTHVADTELDIYFALKYHPGPKTMLKGVSLLGPGESIKVSRGELHRTRHTSRHNHHVPEPDLGALFKTEASRLLTADVPVCLVTSGGLDSSLVASYASERRTDLHTFNIAYTGDWPADERRYARIVSDHLHTIHHEILIDPVDIPSLLQKTVSHLGQPNGAPICVSTYKLFEAIHDAGFKVALTGDGADELFGGYRHAIEAVAAGEDWWETYAYWLIATPTKLRQALYTDDYRNDVRSRSAPESDQLRPPRFEGDILSSLMDFELMNKFPVYHLLRVDHLSMAHSVEARLLFCQRQIIAASRAIPQSRKIQGDQGKAPLYNLASARLPRAVLDRPKQPFTLPLAEMMHRARPLSEFAESVLTDATVLRDGQLDPSKIQKLIKRCRESPSIVGAQAIWTLMVYQLWRDSLRNL